METNLRLPRTHSKLLPATTGLLLLLLASEAKAEPRKVYGMLDLEAREGDYLALEPGAYYLLGAPTAVGRPIAFFARGEVAVAGSGAGIGLMVDQLSDDCGPYPTPRDLFFSFLVSLEARAERMYGHTSWNHTTYVGPQFTFALVPAILPKVSVGWMINPRNAADNHVQSGIGFGW